jgi:hypothetical protein
MLFIIRSIKLAAEEDGTKVGGKYSNAKKSVKIDTRKKQKF